MPEEVRVRIVTALVVVVFGSVFVRLYALDLKVSICFPSVVNFSDESSVTIVCGI